MSAHKLMFCIFST